LWLACVLLFPIAACGDGCFIATTALEKPQIPDQRALIHFANGTETLVIDTAIEGGGTNVAWIIPVPSVPTVDAATKGLFSTLQMIFQPTIVHDVVRLYWDAVILAVIIGLVILRISRGESFLGLLVILAVLLVLASMLLPALGTASVSAVGRSAAQVTVIERKQVGIYDTAVVQSSDGVALFDWLHNNGFQAGTDLVPAICGYATNGWYFVASKLRLQSPLSGAANVHPLTLKFKTNRAVYPLRLTGIDNGECHIDLFVFGSSRAEIPHFTVERCGAPTYPEHTPGFQTPPGLRIRHPLLRELVAGSTYATKLSGVLNGSEMREDAYITWVPARDKLRTRYSEQGALTIALNVAVPLLAIGVLSLLCAFAAADPELAWAKGARKVSGVICLAAVVAGATTYLALPKTPVVTAIRPIARTKYMHTRIFEVLLDRIPPNRLTADAKSTTNLEWIRQQLNENATFRRLLPDRCQTNLFTGEPLREEDSPGNYTVRQNKNALLYIWYDLDGGENILSLSEPPKQ
jgi:drug/metabolite transporter (DMT)-like permease